MKGKTGAPRDNFTPALEAIDNLLQQELNAFFSAGGTTGLSAHTEIEFAPVSQKSAAFYRCFLPLRKNLVSLLTGNYRRLFRLALAHPHEAGRDPHQWTWGQLELAIGAALEWIRDWFVLACDGENQWVQHVGRVEYVPGQTVSLPFPTSIQVSPTSKSWRAPPWLFAVSLALVGVGLLKEEHIPARDSDEKLGIAHTRLLLKGARRVFLWELGAAIERVRNEETAAVGTIPAELAAGRTEGSPKAPKHWLKGFEGLGPKKGDLSRYMHKMTEKQQLAFSLKYEYGLGPTEIASRMGIDRKTVREHLDAANRKVEEDRSFEKRRINRSKTSHDE